MKQTNATRIEIINCDLCIIGTGATGLNALFSASQYLTQKDRVILVDRRSAVGGMWNETYTYVKLHQPYRLFTVGNIQWKLNKRPSYLARRDEIIEHFKYCVKQLKDKVE